jgi:hypothetical protein
MAVRTMLAKAVKATLVASAIIAGLALVAPGMASDEARCQAGPMRVAMSTPA